MSLSAFTPPQRGSAATKIRISKSETNPKAKMPMSELAVLVCCSAGCGKCESPTADPQPFKAAITQYLERNNMAMALKEIKAGPTIEGKTATLTASLQHASLPGPAVTWRFRFEPNPDGTWNVVSHK
jgi:hypothetical protein